MAIVYKCTLYNVHAVDWNRRQPQKGIEREKERVRAQEDMLMHRRYFDSTTNTIPDSSVESMTDTHTHTSARVCSHTAKVNRNRPIGGGRRFLLLCALNCMFDSFAWSLIESSASYRQRDVCKRSQETDTAMESNDAIRQHQRQNVADNGIERPNKVLARAHSTEWNGKRTEILNPPPSHAHTHTQTQCAITLLLSSAYHWQPMAMKLQLISWNMIVELPLLCAMCANIEYEYGIRSHHAAAALRLQMANAS